MNNQSDTPTPSIQIISFNPDIRSDEYCTIEVNEQIGSYEFMSAYTISGLFKHLTNSDFDLVTINYDTLPDKRLAYMRNIITSIKTVSSCANRKIPKTFLYSARLRDVCQIRQILEAGFDGVDCNADKSSIDARVNNLLRVIAGGKIIDVESKHLISITTTARRRGTILETKIQLGTVAYYCVPKLPTEVADKTVNLLLKELNIKCYSISNITDLFPILSNPLHQVDIVWLDAETLRDFNGASMFDIINTVTTLINSTGRKNRTRLYIAVNGDTPIELIRECMKMKGVAGIHGISGYLTWDETKLQLTKALQGKQYLTDKIRDRLNDRKNKPLKSVDSLTMRESQCLKLLLDGGNTNKVIANTLGVTEATIKVYMGNIFKKHHVHNRGELISKLSKSERTAA